ncbi:MAG TPA: hypothetical protein VF597_03480 [Candidatus Saccharimonadales bacterium]|jgi:hypothetical protein
MPETRYIRIKITDLPHETARAALVKALRRSESSDRPTLTKANSQGFYYAVIRDQRQVRLFVGFLKGISVRHHNLSQMVPGDGRIVEPAPTPPASASDYKSLTDLMDVLFGSSRR